MGSKREKYPEKCPWDLGPNQHLAKAPNIWTSSTEEERLKYVRKVLISNGFNEPKIIKKFTEPALNIFNFLSKDPFYCLIATKE